MESSEMKGFELVLRSSSSLFSVLFQQPPSHTLRLLHTHSGSSTHTQAPPHTLRLLHTHSGSSTHTQAPPHTLRLLHTHSGHSRHKLTSAASPIFKYPALKTTTYSAMVIPCFL
ncbi:unnamed protein product [Lota lota]